MDWQTIVASIGTSSVIASGVGYLLKRAFDQTLAVQVDKIKTENKALIEENARRYAFIYDKQYDAFKLVLSLTYRLRNLIRDLSDHTYDVLVHQDRELFDRFQAYHSALVDLIYEERAILPNSIFAIAHDSKNVSFSILSNFEYLQRRQTHLSHEVIQQRLQEIRADYDLIDQLYNRLVHEIQMAIGLKTTDAQQIVGRERR
jgi:hypothetical protein